MRLIDADKLRDDIFHDSDYDNDTINHFLDLVDEQPEVDAEPVVRCKDCKYHLKHRNGICCDRGFLRGVHKNHYCGYGAKMDENKCKI